MAQESFRLLEVTEVEKEPKYCEWNLITSDSDEQKKKFWWAGVILGRFLWDRAESLWSLLTVLIIITIAFLMSNS